MRIGLQLIIIFGVALAVGAVCLLFILDPKKDDSMFLETKLRNWAIFAGIGGVMTAIGAVAAASITFKIAKETRIQEESNFQQTLNEFKNVIKLQESGDSNRKQEFTTSVNRLDVLGQQLSTVNQFRLNELQTRFENTIFEIESLFTPMQGNSLTTEETDANREGFAKIINGIIRLTSQEFSNPHLFTNKEMFQQWIDIYEKAKWVAFPANKGYSAEYVRVVDIAGEVATLMEMFHASQSLIEHGKLTRPAKDFNLRLGH